MVTRTMTRVESSVKLHWTYDYDYQNRLAFGDELLAALASYGSSCGGGHSHTYTVLTNYWRGFRPDAGRLAFGEATIERREVEEGIEYRCSYRNEASGEELRLRYRCKNGTRRELLSPWRIESRNHAACLYDSFAAEGRIVDRGDKRCVTLTVGRLDVPAGDVDKRLPLICNWSLFDVVPGLAEPLEFTMIDDLEKLKPHSRIQRLEDHQQDSPRGRLALSGYVEFGEGDAPRYWWVDADGNVAIMTTTFSTFVLKRIE